MGGPTEDGAPRRRLGCRPLSLLTPLGREAALWAVGLADGLWLASGWLGLAWLGLSLLSWVGLTWLARNFVTFV